MFGKIKESFDIKTFNKISKKYAEHILKSIKGKLADEHIRLAIEYYRLKTTTDIVVYASYIIMSRDSFSLEEVKNGIRSKVIEFGYSKKDADKYSKYIINLLKEYSKNVLSQRIDKENSGNIIICSNCGNFVQLGNYCSSCGHKINHILLEDG